MDGLATLQFLFFFFFSLIDISLGAGRKEESTVKKNCRFHFLEISFCPDFTESLCVIQLRKQLIVLHLEHR